MNSASTSVPISASTFVTVCFLFITTAATFPSLARAQSFPTKPIRIVTSPPGGSSDFASRQIALGLTESLGQNVIVENRGDISGEVVARAAPDGYTLLIDSVSFWLAPLIQKMPYDPIKDFAPITTTSTSPYLLVVHPAVAAKSVKELIDLAKAKPGVLNYSSGPSGNGNHLAAELFKSMAGVDIVRIAYKGAGPAAVALIGGETQVAVLSVSATVPHVKAGRLRALAVTSAQPTALVPGVPSVAASGVPGYEVTSTVAMFAPAKSPSVAINILNRETVRLLQRPDIKERFFNTGVETLGSTPAEFAATIKLDLVRWGKVIKDARIRADGT
jgi:tripartite-type tricarboxylate transporter receptor subunit TctC